VRAILLILSTSSFLLGQNPPPTAKHPEQNPPVKINILNVCTPDAATQQELKAALSRLPKAPNFAIDYEISRGVSTTADGKTARYVWLRRDL
jgi:hypothetical protein